MRVLFIDPAGWQKGLNVGLAYLSAHLIFQSSDAQDLAMKIVYLIHNEELRRKISENARKYILVYHRLDSVVDSIEETLMYILRKNRGDLNK